MNAHAALSEREIDSKRNQLRENILSSDIGSGYAHILTFFIESDISASTYDVEDEDDTRLNIYKLPMQKDFEINEEGWKVALRGVVGYATLKSRQNVLDDIFVDSKWKAFSGSAGTGLIVPVSSDLALLTAADLGISHMTNSSNYTGASSSIISRLFDGILYNWDTDAWIGSLVFGFDYKHLFTETYDLNVTGRYTYSHVSSFNESDGFPSFDGNAQTVSLAADLKHSLGFSIAQYPISGVAHLGNTTFVGDNRDALGFDSFFDLGYSLEIDISDMAFFVNSLRLGYQWSIGSDVKGHTILFGWDVAVF
jgi:hypothetical protein